MCSHYDPVLNPSRLKQYFGVEDDVPPLRPSLWPGYVGTFLRKHEFADVGDEAVPRKELMIGAFGLIPHWSKDDKIVRRTYNARSETAHEKPSFQYSWNWGRHCIIPAEAIFEPDWRSDKAVGTRIVRTDGNPIGIAGLWSMWENPANGQNLHSFTMLTVNADDHEFMRHYHKPEDEKRMAVMLQDDQYDDWLSAKPEESRWFLRPFPAEGMREDLNQEIIQTSFL